MTEDDTEEKPSGYPPVMKREETDAEEQVLGWWARKKQWFEIAMATKKLYMLLMTLLFGSTGIAIHDQVTNSTTFKDVAEEVGLIDEPDDAFFIDRNLETEGGAYVLRSEWKKLVTYLETHDHDTSHEHSESGLKAHTHGASTHEHKPVLFQHQHSDVAAHSHPEQAHKHKDHIHADHQHPEYAPQKHTHAPVDLIAGEGGEAVALPVGSVTEQIRAAVEAHNRDDH